MIDKRNPRIALILGDPCGIGPELVAKLMVDRDTTEKADVVIIGDQNVFDEAVKISLENIAYIEICVGTHNEESCKRVTEHMRRQGLDNNHAHITFSQRIALWFPQL